MQEIKTINLMFPHNLGTANCYLIKTNKGYILIDTGFANKRNELEKEVESAGCKPGNLKLIIITHGDGDHIGNCAYLHKKYGAKIAIHRIESKAIESGNLFLNRKKRHFLKKIIEAIIVRILSFYVKLGNFERFKHDLFLDEGFDLSQYGFHAKVLHIPGHSKGSIGILTADGNLFCGDLFWNMKKPDIHGIIDDLPELNASIERLKKLKIKMIYPGHGRPFMFNELFKCQE